MVVSNEGNGIKCQSGISTENVSDNRIPEKDNLPDRSGSWNTNW